MDVVQIHLTYKHSDVGVVHNAIEPYGFMFDLL